MALQQPGIGSAKTSFSGSLKPGCRIGRLPENGISIPKTGYCKANRSLYSGFCAFRYQAASRRQYNQYGKASRHRSESYKIRYIREPAFRAAQTPARLPYPPPPHILAQTAHPDAVPIPD
ncbi:hypothetical protein H9Q10_11390 [Eikenella sp. S3360]|uniref:Uncharacterized protein n=1 Tax=Eikenella glucosivorans TaxID=2766967 RepID=A0ABS0NDC4_9NEIS|nr:hypothetical protein [Eikenella glucosivorans]MBH5330266.1 hypothetical protein [Eikenella glucosivorans]